MISKISIGSGISGTLDYLLDEKKDAEILRSNAIREDRQQAKKDFRLWASQSPTLGNNVLHIPLAFSSEDKPLFENDSELKVKIIDRYIELMQSKKYSLGNTQYLAIEHHDTAHPHIHLVFNRVDATGRTIRDNFIALSSKKVCQQITQEFGLTPANVRRQKVDRSKLKGKDGLKHDVFRILTAAKEEKGKLSLLEVKQKLGTEGIQIKLLKNNDGIVFGSYYVQKLSDGKEIKIKCSAIDKSLTLPKLLNDHREINGETNSLFTSSGTSFKSELQRIGDQTNDILFSDLKNKAWRQHEMMDDLAKIMTLGLFDTVTVKNKYKSKAAKLTEEEIKFKEKVKLEIDKILGRSINQSTNIESLREIVTRAGINIIINDRQKNIFLEKDGQRFNSDQISGKYNYNNIIDELAINRLNESSQQRIVHKLNKAIDTFNLLSIEELAQELHDSKIILLKTLITNETGPDIKTNVESEKLDLSKNYYQYIFELNDTQFELSDLWGEIKSETRERLEVLIEQDNLFVYADQIIKNIQSFEKPLTQKDFIAALKKRNINLLPVELEKPGKQFKEPSILVEEKLIPTKGLSKTNREIIFNLQELETVEEINFVFNKLLNQTNIKTISSLKYELKKENILLQTINEKETVSIKVEKNGILVEPLKIDKDAIDWILTLYEKDQLNRSVAKEKTAEELLSITNQFKDVLSYVTSTEELETELLNKYSIRLQLKFDQKNSLVGVGIHIGEDYFKGSEIGYSAKKIAGIIENNYNNNKPKGIHL